MVVKEEMVRSNIWYESLESPAGLESVRLYGFYSISV